MRRPQVLALLIAALLVVGVGVALARHEGAPNAAATRSPSPTTTATTTAAPTTTPPATPSTKPTPVGKGPRDREYDVVYAAAVPMDQGAIAAAQAGGEVIHENAATGVVTVRAGRDFVTRARKDKRIYGAVTNRAVGRPPVTEPGRRDTPGGSGPRRTNAGSASDDPLGDLQWDMKLVHAVEARRTEAGDKRVTVAVIDTGVDGSHPDLRAAYDRERSRNFVTDYPGADGPCEVKSCRDPVGTDDDGHGTHVAGTIVAAADGFGMTGIAPGVRLVDLRAGQDSGLFLLMPTVDALVYAGDIGVDVANMSYFVDPWLYNCPNSPDDSANDRYEQRALIEGVRRAVDYAYAKGVTLVAAAGNEHDDLDRPTTDVISPDFPDKAARPRRIDRTCVVLPTGLPHVVEVSSIARDGVKADYSSYGLKHVAVTAPGGSTFLRDGQGPSPSYGTLSTWSARLLRAEGALDSQGRPRTPYVVEYCKGSACAYYRYLTGTSMASPHAAGVAALIVSRFGTADPAHPGTLRMDPARVAKLLRDSATATACPSPPKTSYAVRPPEYTATCEGTREHNGFYGDGIVDALAAVRR
jgi:subtilisin family serine protease